MNYQDNINLIADVDLAADSNPGTTVKAFSMVAFDGTPVSMWGGQIVIDIAGLSAEKPTYPLLVEHDNRVLSVVGQVNKIDKSATNLKASGDVYTDTPEGERIHSNAKKGYRWQASIGCSVQSVEYLEPGTTATVNGREVSGPMAILRQTTLREISIVAIGADPNTSVVVQQSVIQSDHKDVTTRVIMNESQNTGSVPETKPVEQAAPAPVVEQVAPAPAPVQPQRTVEQVRNERPAVSTVQPRTNDVGVDRVFEASLAIQNQRKAGWSDEKLEKMYGEQTLNQAYKYRRMGLKDIAHECCLAEGVQIPRYAEPGEFARLAFSTRSLPNVLKNSANKMMLAGYAAVESSFEKIAKILSAKDFKTHSIARLSGEYMPEKVGPEGELKHATITDQGYDFAVETFGKIAGLTRQDIINDDLNAFSELPFQFGRGAKNRIEKTGWAKVVAASGSGFFASGNNNVISGATSALGADGVGLQLAITKLERQTDENGDPIAAMPKFLVVPTELKFTAEQLYSSIYLITGENATKAGTNIHAGKYLPVSSPFLTAAGVWYLFADPMDLPAFGLAFLNGDSQPVMESADPDPKYLGQQWRMYFDFGVCELDPRGAVRSAGA